jgi:alkylhydroperoxidase family enzyme
VLGDAVTQAVLVDWRTAPIEPKLRATLGLLEKLTLTPADVGPEDMAMVCAAGVSERAILDAVYISAAFNLIDRVADALEFDIPPSFAKGAPSLLQRGYKI